MNIKCKCGGTLIHCDYQLNPEVIAWKCPNCQTIVTQRKRRPYKLDAEKDIIKIQEHLNKLLERNPINHKSATEWWRFLTELWGVYRNLQTKLTDYRRKELNDNTGD